jgi:putative transposase
MPQLSVRKLCRSLEVNRQWYYQHRCLSAHQEYDQRLRQAIQEIREAFAGYGYRRVTKALVRAGWRVNHKWVWRVMRQVGLTCRRKRRTVHTTDSKHSYQIYPNLVKGLQVEAPNRCWVADLTYVRLPEGFVYLACILDVYSRKCIGWSLSRRIDAQLPLQALEIALAQLIEQPYNHAVRKFGCHYKLWR